MELIRRDELTKQPLPGRMIQNAVGKGAPVQSSNMSVGFATYSREFGPMEPHRHDEESIYVISSDKAYMLYGDSEKELNGRRDLEAGMVLHFDKNEWHVFRYEEGGHLEIVFIYGKTDDLRPEKVEDAK